MREKRIYFDHNATSPMSQKVGSEVVHWLSKPMNPSSVHAQGQHAKGIMEQTRDLLGNYINASEADITFMSGGTEANTTVFTKLLDSLSITHCVVGTTEHISVLQAAQNSGVAVSYLPCNQNGQYDSQQLDDLLKEKNCRTLVSLMLANNETGVVQNIKQMTIIAHKHKCVLHTDAAQALGKINVNFKDIGCDIMTLCGHKMGALTGVGALVTKPDIHFAPLIVGGGHEYGRRAGTENILAIASWMSVLKNTQDKELSTYILPFAHVLTIRTYLENELTKRFSNIYIIAQGQDRLPNTILCCFKDYDAMELLILLDIRGVSVSIGAACSSGSTKGSHVLKAMGYSQEVASRTLRISLGPEHRKEDIDIFLGILENIFFKKS